eukprot:3168071-Pleurochrysis_carterae.AAC.1
MTRRSLRGTSGLQIAARARAGSCSTPLASAPPSMCMPAATDRESLGRGAGKARQSGRSGRSKAERQAAD